MSRLPNSIPGYYGGHTAAQNNCTPSKLPQPQVINNNSLMTTASAIWAPLPNLGSLKSGMPSPPYVKPSMLSKEDFECIRTIIQEEIKKGFLANRYGEETATTIQNL